MIQDFVSKYMNQLSLEDLKKFAKNHSISYTDEELNTVYLFLKEHYTDLLQQNTSVLEELKSKINPDLYHKLLELYQFYGNKYL